MSNVAHVASLDPGLVYDANVQDYVDFLSALNYSAKHIRAVTKKNKKIKCDRAKKYSLGDLDYPSFTVPFKTDSGKCGNNRLPTVIKYTRSPTNVVFQQHTRCQCLP